MLNLNSKNINAKFRIFDAVSKSILCYAAQVWGYTRYEEVERILRFFIKKTLWLPYNTPNYFILSETGRMPLFLFELHLNFVKNTARLPDSRFSKIVCKHFIENEIG